MRNKRVGTKMLISVGITLLLSLLLIVLSIRTISSTRNSYDDILDSQVDVTSSVQESEILVNSIARQLRDMALFGYSASTMDQIESSVTALDNTMKDIQSHDLGTNLNSLSNQYIQEIQDWESVFADISQALQSGNSAQANQLIQNQCSPKLNQAVATGESLIAQLNDLSLQQIGALQSRTTRDIVILIVIVVISFVVGLSLNMYVVRSIVAPLRKTQEAVVAFSQGDLSYALDYESKDEIGGICNAVRTSQ